ncbi:MAG: response regulator [Syntrophobacteraceae bacterium CG2_30_61_12]|nr:MAG: response regulator [Syntrophobacteraceae bacterium CG2_30_61_12]
MANILVLDDVYDAAHLIDRILTRKGHQVQAFTDEDEAILYARSHPVDLAILDIKLKKMSGIEVLGLLKEIDPKMRVMLLTGYPTLDTARQALELGAGEYCVKPIEKDDLEEKVAGLLDSHAGSGALPPSV